jgi:hypothetical protein
MGAFMNALRFSTVAAVSSLVLVAGTALAASDYFLQIGGAKGDAAAAPVAVESFSWGVHKSGAGATGAAKMGSGKANFQDLSMTSAQPRDVSTGAATGRSAAPAAAAGADASADATPRVGDVADFTVVTRESPSKGTDAVGRDCVKGQHFPSAVLTGQGKRVELTDVEVTSCAAAAGTRTTGYRGHVTLMK